MRYKKQFYKEFIQAISYYQMSCTGDFSGRHFPKVVEMKKVREVLKTVLKNYKLNPHDK